MNKKYILVLLSFSVFSFLSGRYLFVPTKIVEVEKIVYKDKIDIEEITNLHKTSHTVKTTKPDGTTIEEIEIDLSKDSKKDSSETSSTEKETSKTVEFSREKVLISAIAKASLTSFIPTYGASVQSRLLGPVWMGAFGFLDGTVGLSLSLSF